MLFLFDEGTEPVAEKTEDNLKSKKKLEQEGVPVRKRIQKEKGKPPETKTVIDHAAVKQAADDKAELVELRADKVAAKVAAKAAAKADAKSKQEKDDENQVGDTDKD